MIVRYSLPEMAKLWSESHKLSMWTEVEALVVEAWEQVGVAPEGAGQIVRSAPAVDPTAWKERERITHHDVAAFVDLLISSSGPTGSWIHYGLTSSDVLDTAQATVLRDAADLLIEKIAALFDVVKRRAFEHRDAVMVGRTHGMWAEPTTFGLKLATWAFELERDHARMRHARESVAVGKISGAVGTYAQAPPAIEAYVCKRLGLGIEPASSQTTHRDRHAELIQTIALTGSSIERFATEIRHLQRSELGEVQEPFQPGQKGSSAMPHKRNPILSERMVGLARVLRGYAVTALENVSLWHERDISHSSAERVILPDACTTLDYMLATFTRVIDGLVVKPERMQANLDATHGLVFSQSVLLALVDAGLTRDEAYRIVQRDAAQAWDEGRELRDLLMANPDVPLDDDGIAACFDPERHLRNAGVVFERLSELVL
ncbi:MAG: adenylosuccinate lyase [Gammaproteobacteria bacterium]|nr:adenylosuccinate lyase [Gammaproteobacteria bacterium]